MPVLENVESAIADPSFLALLLNPCLREDDGCQEKQEPVCAEFFTSFMGLGYTG